jgi:hypothetical protein
VALRSFVGDNGPIIAVSVVALAFPAAVLGLKRTALAGTCHVTRIGSRLIGR